ncbi:hypothetical protein FOL47_007740 [Perkinsus chesapeaki]|uniref:Uncharacterized protein n=1 Tax=Perkinsus chesapeaki TaxID=330153 RepID=A0A7J6LIQ0_PERCH|nr:hypothetical protein FOL47_007740 [Perkinsus chesapeaki]
MSIVRLPAINFGNNGPCTVGFSALGETFVVEDKKIPILQQPIKDVVAAATGDMSEDKKRAWIAENAAGTDQSAMYSAILYAHKNNKGPNTVGGKHLVMGCFHTVRCKLYAYKGKTETSFKLVSLQERLRQIKEAEIEMKRATEELKQVDVEMEELRAKLAASNDALEAAKRKRSEVRNCARQEVEEKERSVRQIRQQLDACKHLMESIKSLKEKSDVSV